MFTITAALTDHLLCARHSRDLHFSINLYFSLYIIRYFPYNYIFKMYIKFFESSHNACVRGTVFIFNTQIWKLILRKTHKTPAERWKSQDVHSSCVTAMPGERNYVSSLFLHQRELEHGEGKEASPGCTACRESHWISL